MNRNLLIAGGVAAIAGGALLYMKRNGLGPWSPGESNLDELAAAGGGFTSSQLSDADRSLLGLGPKLQPSKAADTGKYASGIAAYMSSWRARGAGVPADKAAAIPIGGYGVDNVSCGPDASKTVSGEPYAGLRDPAGAGMATPGEITTPNGGKFLIRPVRGFQLNPDELAIYAPDAGRLWGLVEGVTDRGTRVDLFVTPHARQKIGRTGAVLGSGLVFAWHPALKRWLKPDEWRPTGLPSRQISDVGSQNMGNHGITQDEFDIYGYSDRDCKRIKLGNLKYLARTSRTKSIPAGEA